MVKRLFPFRSGTKLCWFYRVINTFLLRHELNISSSSSGHISNIFFTILLGDPLKPRELSAYSLLLQLSVGETLSLRCRSFFGCFLLSVYVRWKQCLHYFRNFYRTSKVRYFRPGCQLFGNNPIKIAFYLPAQL